VLYGAGIAAVGALAVVVSEPEDWRPLSLLAALAILNLLADTVMVPARRINRYPSLLDFAEACDVPVGFGCRNGTCHNCESGLLAGAITYSPDPLELPPDGRILVCCSRPTSELALDL
jgi:ferredoxin